MNPFIHKVLSFLGAAFSENGSPSSSRILSAWLSVSSMALVWWIVRHAMELKDQAQLAAWLGLLPTLIWALTTFAVSPYGITKITGIWGNKPSEPPAPPANQGGQS